MLLLFVCYSVVTSCYGDSLYVRRITDTLSSEVFFGRGYVKGGLQKASDFIQAEMRRIGLQVQLQPFSHPVNTFPKNTYLEINGQRLKPGIDFISASHSAACKGSGTLQPRGDSLFANERNTVFVQNCEKITWTANTGHGDFAYIQLLKFPGTPVNYKCDIDAVMIENF